MSVDSYQVKLVTQKPRSVTHPLHRYVPVNDEVWSSEGPTDYVLAGAESYFKLPPTPPGKLYLEVYNHTDESHRYFPFTVSKEK